MKVNGGHVLAAAVAAVSQPTSPVSVQCNERVMTSLMPAILDHHGGESGMGGGDATASNGLAWPRNNGNTGCATE